MKGINIMGMNTNVCGFKPPDEKWKKMKAIWDACGEAGVGTPTVVLEFFEHSEPDEAGVKVDIENTNCCLAFNNDSNTGFDILRDKLPKDVKIIRFYNSW